MKPIATRLLEWYARQARRLPWRSPPGEPAPDPYRVWVSEIMLQQTRVETVIPYFERWLERFPDLHALADAPEQEVLRLWEGLGYYSRARNLHRAARQVVADYGGRLPGDVERLEKLPGIGRYTAGAIASIAFGQDQPALDGNIRRILARLFNMDLPARSPKGEKRLWELARQELPPGRAGDFNQALMDLGSSICLPTEPRCLLCPLTEYCQARTLGLQEQRPVLESRRPVPRITVTAAVIERNGRYLLAQRPPDGLLGGLWEFPGGKQEPGESLPEALVREIQEELGVKITVGEELGIYQHAYTHFKVTLHAFFCSLIQGEPQALAASNIRWALLSELSSFPMGKIDRRISQDLLRRKL